MKLLSYVLLVGILVVGSEKANAFDRIYCQSKIADWIVTLTEDTSTAILTPYNQHVTLSEERSEVFIVKNEKNQMVITIFPWNSLYIRQSEQSKQLYKVTSSESDAGFIINIQEKTSKKTRSLSCRFTF